MKIVHVEDFFHPDAGYQINILPKYMVKQGHSVTIVTSEMDRIPVKKTSFFGKNGIEERDKAYSQDNGVDIIRLPLLGYVSGRAVFSQALFSTVEHLHPDVLFMHGNDTLTAMRYLTKIKKLNFPIVMDSHMLEMASKNKLSRLYRGFYRKVFTPIILKNKIPVIRTQNDDYVEKHLGIPLAQSPWISVGSDTILFHPDGTMSNEFRRKLGVEKDDFLVLYTGKLDEEKGGLLLAEAFKKRFPSSKNVVLVAVGNATGGYGQRVEKELSLSENRIIRFPTQRYCDLASFYQAADLCVFPRQCSLSFYDAQACGLPVVSEDNNINIDRLSNNNGFNFQAGDVDDFREQIIRCVEMPNEEYGQLRRNAHKFVKQSYDYADVAQVYTDLIQYQLIERQRRIQSS